MRINSNSIRMWDHEKHNKTKKVLVTQLTDAITQISLKKQHSELFHKVSSLTECVTYDDFLHILEDLIKNKVDLENTYFFNGKKMTILQALCDQNIDSEKLRLFLSSGININNSGESKKHSLVYAMGLRNKDSSLDVNRMELVKEILVEMSSIDLEGGTAGQILDVIKKEELYHYASIFLRESPDFENSIWDKKLHAYKQLYVYQQIKTNMDTSIQLLKNNQNQEASIHDMLEHIKEKQFLLDGEIKELIHKSNRNERISLVLNSYLLISERKNETNGTNYIRMTDWVTNGLSMLLKELKQEKLESEKQKRSVDKMNKKLMSLLSSDL